MCHTLFHLYGPFAVHSYGVAIAIGIFVFSFLIKKDPRFKKLNLTHTFTEILLLSILVGLLGGRILYLLSEPNSFSSFTDLVTFWNGGFSVLGSIISILLVVPLYLKKIAVPIIPFLDLAAIYAPLLQSISRIGCFFAGCCYGLPTSLPWGYAYTDIETVAPINCILHPTQLYSSALLLFIFIIQYFFTQKYFTKPGQLLCIYLILASTERFLVDFLRADRTFVTSEFFNAISINQIVALGIFASSIIAYFIFRPLLTKVYLKS